MNPIYRTPGRKVNRRTNHYLWAWRHARHFERKASWYARAGRFGLSCGAQDSASFYRHLLTLQVMP